MARREVATRDVVICKQVPVTSSDCIFVHPVFCGRLVICRLDDGSRWLYAHYREGNRVAYMEAEWMNNCEN